MIQQKLLHLLLVEDNPGDVRLMKLVLGEAETPHLLHVATDGGMALDFVFQRGEFVGAPVPDIIILDLNLPVRNGIDVLSEIRQSAALKRIPVVVLTSSQAERDVAAAYDCGANAYMRKASDLDQTFALVKQIENYWMRSAVLPGRAAAV